MKQTFSILLAVAALWLAGCGGEADNAPPASQAVAPGQQPGTAAVAESPATPAAGQSAANESANIAAVLSSLTDTVRKYSVEKRRVPADLNEIVAAGYLRAVPPAPPGHKFVINSRREVVLEKD